MPTFGAVSRGRLDTCHPDLQKIMEEVITRYDIAIICGHRGEQAQREAYDNNKSQVNWPRSKHNEYPSKAVDIAPYPLDWGDHAAFALLAGWVMCIADQMLIDGRVSHTLRWGGDWNSNRKTKDHGFLDFPHFELVG